MNKKIDVLVTRSQSDYIEVEVDENLSEEEQYKMALIKAKDHVDDVDFYHSGDCYFHIQEKNISNFAGLKSGRFYNASRALQLAFEDDEFTQHEMLEFLELQKTKVKQNLELLSRKAIYDK